MDRSVGKNFVFDEYDLSLFFFQALTYTIHLQSSKTTMLLLFLLLSERQKTMKRNQTKYLSTNRSQKKYIRSDDQSKLTCAYTYIYVCVCVHNFIWIAIIAFSLFFFCIAPPLHFYLSTGDDWRCFHSLYLHLLSVQFG